MFETKSLNCELYNLNTFKNSTGIKSKNIDKKNKIRNQNIPCPFHDIIFESTRPVDSSKR